MPSGFLQILFRMILLIGSINILYGETTSIIPKVSSDTVINKMVEKNGSLPDSIPHIVNFIKAEYPPSAIERGIEGSVILDLLVSDTGSVDSVAIVKAIDTLLGKAAAAAATKFRFTPARFNGMVEPVILRYEYRFSLDEVADSIPTAINFKGSLLEYGSRIKVTNSFIQITPLDTGLIVGKLSMHRYLERLGAIEHYQIDNRSLVASPDSLGRFSFRALPSCACSVKVISPGYKIMSDYVVIKKNQLTEATFYLRPSGFGNDAEIVVYGKHRTNQISDHALTPTEIRRVPGFSGDAIRVIQAMPGVSRSTFGGGQLMVRGSGPFDNKYFIDGIEVPYVYHAISTQAIPESIYNGYLLSRVDFYPGGFDTRYGGAIGGVIDVKPREARTDGVHGSFELSILKGSLAIETPVSPKIALCASYRRSYLGIYKNLIKTMVPGISQMPYYQDYMARIDFTQSKNHHLFFSLVGADDGVEIVDNSKWGGNEMIDSAVNAFKFKAGFKLFSIGSDYKTGDSWSNEFRFGIRPMTGTISSFGQFKYSMNNGMVYSLKNTATVPINDRMRAYCGIDISYKSGSAGVRYLDSILRTYIKTLDIFTGGPFCGLDLKAIDKLTITPGIRIDFHYPLDFPGTIIPEFWDYSFDNTTRFKVAPALRVKAVYEASTHHAFQAMTGTYTALPHITDSSLAGSLFGDDAAIFEAMNPVTGKQDAQLIHSQQNVLGYTWTPDPVFSAEIQVYINNQWNVTRYATVEEYAQGPQDNVWVRDNGKVRTKGLELLLRRSEGERFFGWISYTLSQSEEFNPWTRIWSKRDWDITNYFQMIGSVKITPNFEFGFRLRYTDGFWYTPVTGRQFYDEDSSKYVFEWGQPKSKRMAPYVNVDLRIERKIATKWATIHIIAEVINLVNILEFIHDKNGKPIYRMPEGNWFQYNYYGDEKDFQTYIPLGSLGFNVEF